MKILLSGASGFIGSHLSSFFKDGKHEVVSLIRNKNKEGIFWDPEKQVLSKDEIEGFDVVINLAGENIGNGRWSQEKKKRIYESRVKSTQLLADTITKLTKPPKVYVNASAIGYYGTDASGTVNEDSPSGKGFLAKVCKDWENAALPISQAGIRTIFTRFGAVLGANGGALSKMLIPFKLGLGGKIGTGKQWMGWIAIDDLILAMHHCMMNASISGPANFTSPQLINNEEFTKALGQVLHRPTIFPLPAAIAKLILGEMAEEVLLSSIKAEPTILINSHYSFRYPDIKQALQHMLGKDG